MKEATSKKLALVPGAPPTGSSRATPSATGKKVSDPSYCVPWRFPLALLQRKKYRNLSRFA